MPTQLAQRVANLPPYIFAGLERRISQMISEGRDVIRLDIGSPDQPPSPEIVEALYRSAKDPTHHGYAGYFGTPQLRRAISDYYLRRFDVELDPKTQVLPLLGSKEGIFNLAWAYLDPGDIALVPDPGYPTYTAGANLAGGEIYYFPLEEKLGWLPDLDAIPSEVLRRAKLMWLNYPNNPTTATAPIEFLERALAFARKNDILLAHDNPYCDVCFDGYVPPSLIQVPGAKDYAVEFNSTSKTYNMGGWRVGMAVGNPQAISALSRLKTSIDSGIFRAVQDAAVEALTGNQEWLSERNDVYTLRRDIVVNALPATGMTADKPKSTMYVWVKLPAGVTGAEYADRLLDQANVSVTPGIAFGPQSIGYVRISLGQDTERIREAMERIKKLADG